MELDATFKKDWDCRMWWESELWSFRFGGLFTGVGVSCNLKSFSRKVYGNVTVYLR